MNYYGIVEDIDDPLELGRVRVRVFEVHSFDLSDIPVESLPWASVMQPTTSSANSGIGTTPRLLNGTLVVVFFADPKEMQMPIVIGTLPSEIKEHFINLDDVEVKFGSEGYGFQDPDAVYPKKTMSGENDISLLARPEKFEKHPSYTSRVRDRNSFGSKETANAPDLTTIPDSKKDDSFYATTTFEEPYIMGDETPAITYPGNQVKETESGMVEEWDDNNVRRHSYHPSGTYEEIVADGSKTIKIVGLGSDIYMDGRNLFIEGDWNIVVTGNKRELIQGDYILEVEGNMSTEVKKDEHRKVGANSYQEIGSNQVENIGGNRTTTIAQNETLTVGKDRATSIGEDEFRTVAATEEVSIGDNAHHRYSKNLKETVKEKSTRLTAGDSSLTTGGTAYYAQTNTIFRTKEEETWTVNNGNRTTNIETGNEQVTIAGNQNITASVTNIANNTNVTGTVTATTEVTAGSINLTTHTHTQPDTSANATSQGDTGGPQ